MRLVELIHQRLLTVHIFGLIPSGETNLRFATGAIGTAACQQQAQRCNGCACSNNGLLHVVPKHLFSFERVDGIICVIDSHKV